MERRCRACPKDLAGRAGRIIHAHTITAGAPAQNRHGTEYHPQISRRLCNCASSYHTTTFCRGMIPVVASSSKDYRNLSQKYLNDWFCVFATPIENFSSIIIIQSILEVYFLHIFSKSSFVMVSVLRT